MSALRFIVLIGRYSDNVSEKPHCLYCGLEGVESAAIAKKAQQSGKYAKGGQIREVRNAAGRPMPTVPEPVQESAPDGKKPVGNGRKPDNDKPEPDDNGD